MLSQVILIFNHLRKYDIIHTDLLILCLTIFILQYLLNLQIFFIIIKIFTFTRFNP